MKGFLHMLFLGCFLTVQCLFASPKDDKNKRLAGDKNKKKDDTCHIINSSVGTYDNSDSLLMFPSHDLYGCWDTSSCHPDLFNLQFQGDSAIVYLLDDYNCGFTLPFKGIVTSGFGWRHRRPHFGTDISLHTGDTVASAFDGKVRIARYIQGYGNVVIIRHNNGLETVYGHLSKILVQPEEAIVSGMTIGLGGNTGHSFGSHLHFEIRYLGMAIDAEDVVDFNKGEVKNNSFVIFKEDFSKKYNMHRNIAHKSSRSYAVSRYEPVTKTKGGGKIIVIRNGDTLERIARRNHTTIDALCKKNGIRKSKVLQIGQKLKA